MKKILVIVTLLLIFGFLNSSATCPSGWTSHNVTFSMGTNPTCNFTIYYCSFTSPGGVNTLKFDRILLDYTCINYLYNQTFWDEAVNQMTNDYHENATFTACPHTSVTLVVKRAVCWKIENDTHEGVVKAINCGLIGECVWEYVVCTDFSKQPAENIIVYEGYESIATELCPNSIPTLPPIGKTWNDDWTTDCYGVTCPTEE